MVMCEKCGERYTPTLSVLNRGLCRKCANESLGTPGLPDLYDQQDSPMRPAPAGDESRDFFISYYFAQQSQAIRINSILRSMGKSTWFFEGGGGTGSYRQPIREALERSRRVICILSPGYFHSTHCVEELDKFWETNDRDAERRVIFLEVEPCRIPTFYEGTRPERLLALDDETFQGKVEEVIESTERSFVNYDVHSPYQEEDEGHAVVSHRFRFKQQRAWLAAAAALLLGVYYLTYFRYGPQDVWDVREAATYATLGKDISLPWIWTFAPANLREYVSGSETEAVDYWRQPGGLPSQFQSMGAFLRPVGISLLRSTLPESGPIEGGIAQFRAVFPGQSISLMADARRDGRAYRGFRLDNDRQGVLTATFFEREPGGTETTLMSYPPKRVGTAMTLHDIGVSKKDGFYTLWHNRAVLATWPPQGAEPRRMLAGWQSGAFGLAANGSRMVRIFRWSLAANRAPGELPQVAKAKPTRPILVSYFAMPGHRQLRDDEESWLP